ncbi:hypothetical protein Srubr_20110 [Streptomyces rubradiris]|uniref:Uncharacterized protein n=1 Tax=Streptomyces rubradiris TaxID=285531 RepID=A0ABQ3R8I6_STRRR|nr:hypothetical protein GCM10018792_59850 [Streptomyces rubradiris]GHI52165.1 hypothetical protein Srubr_20110 [Streptomyces rubradiris]
MREDRLRQEAGGPLTGGRVGAVAAVRGEGAGEPGVDVGLHAQSGAAGELVADGFVALAGLGLLQCAQLARRLELVGAGRDPLRLAYGGVPFGGGRGLRGELGLDDVVGVRVVHGARRGSSEELVGALPLGQFRRRRSSAARSSCREACLASNRTSWRARATAAASMPFARRRTTRGASGAPGRPGSGHRRPRLCVREGAWALRRPECGSVSRSRPASPA